MRNKLKALRAEHLMTQGEMAAILGVSRTAYINIENGKSNGSIEFWVRVAKEFPDADIVELYERVEK